jgi:hypothetical protein
MKYILLIYQNPIAFRSLDDSERLALMDQAGSIMNELMAAGEWVSGEGLADPSTAKTARVRDGIPTVTDGPFAEAKEHVVGYAIIDCESQERAIEIALRWPDSRLWGVEVRAILSPNGAEM